MNPAITAIIKKDFFTRVLSPSFWLFLGLANALWSIFYALAIMAFVTQSVQMTTDVGRAYLHTHHSLVSNYIVVVHYVMIFLVAILSLSFFTEEKKEKTLNIYLTHPLTSWQIVISKTLGGLLLIFMIIAFSALLPLTLAFYNALTVSLYLWAYFGLFLILSVYVCCAVLASALTDSTLLCVMLSLIAILGLLIMGGVQDWSDTAWVRDFFAGISFNDHFSYFRNGIVSARSVVLLISLCVFILALAERVIEFHRWR